MPRLSLQIVRGPHPPSVAVGHPITAVRLLTEISVQTNDAAWSKFRGIIVDTGAPVSLLPRPAWRNAAFVLHGHVHVGGIEGRAECRVPAMLAEVDAVLSDGSSMIGPLRIHAYLAESDRVPALLGISGFLETAILGVDVGANGAWLDDGKL